MNSDSDENLVRASLIRRYLIVVLKSDDEFVAEGDKWKVVVPSELGYGEQGAGPGSDIGPNQVLIFEIELLDVKGDE